MIKATELRLGNLLGYWSDVIRVTPDHFAVISNGSKSYEPIPLTPEILEAIGFGSRRIENNYTIYSYGTNPHTHDFMLVLHYLQGSPFFCYQGVLTKIYFVHQLQNLYFALTGEDLSITL